MAKLEDLRKAVEATVGTLTPANAQRLAKGLLEPGAAKEQVSKVAGELMQWSQRNRERIAEVVRTEIAKQLGNIGAVSHEDLEALERRIRKLERMAAKPTTRKTTTTRAKSSGAKRTTTSTAKTAAELPPGSSGDTG